MWNIQFLSIKEMKISIRIILTSPFFGFLIQKKCSLGGRSYIWGFLGLNPLLNFCEKMKKIPKFGSTYFSHDILVKITLKTFNYSYIIIDLLIWMKRYMWWSIQQQHYKQSGSAFHTNTHTHNISYINSKK